MRFFIFSLLSACALSISHGVHATEVAVKIVSNKFHQPPEAFGTIEDQTLSLNPIDCGPNSLNFDVTPYFDSHGDSLNYCLSSIDIEGSVTNFKITLNPFTGKLTIPEGWWGVNTNIYLHIVAKNPYGSATQPMKIFLEPCGG
jgi:hypothetical protein